jgi:hypothetical protein
MAEIQFTKEELTLRNDVAIAVMRALNHYDSLPVDANRADYSRKVNRETTMKAYANNILLLVQDHIDNLAKPKVIRKK